MMRRGELYNYRDPASIRGTGVVALLVEFPPTGDGHQWIAMQWLGKHPCLTFWPSIGDLLEVHAHLGAAEIRWFDPDPFDVDADPMVLGSSSQLS
ncbi:hypothetical protein ACIA49_33055 [Kribbella sp. NPDC051587]|uniref:hypothetical protein n=1 Tax=Kribbella sp. NPDC051587 TaxID=3364119 RepID=UPI003797A9C2